MLTILVILSYLLVIFSVGQLIAIRWLRDPVFIHGAPVRFNATVGYVAVTLSYDALLVGFVLPYSLSVARSRSIQYFRNWTCMVNNAGDVCGWRPADRV